MIPELQGRRIVTSATCEAIALARSEQEHPFLHAYPLVDSAASNGICRKLGFTLVGAYDFEYQEDAG